MRGNNPLGSIMPLDVPKQLTSETPERREGRLRLRRAVKQCIDMQRRGMSCNALNMPETDGKRPL